MSKYQKYYQEMIDKNWKIFTSFKNLHDLYVSDMEKWKSQFNLDGALVLDIIRDWERKLCQHSEKGKYSKFSSNLSDKFWELVRQDYPKIDFVGVK